jgi:hypothetical protein
MNKEKLTEAKENRAKVFLRMSETPSRPLEIVKVHVKKIFTEQPKSLNVSKDTISVRVRFKGGRCSIVQDKQLFPDYESALLDYETPTQNPDGSSV